MILSSVSCGHLTVPENRARPGRTIRLLVIRILPADGMRSGEPVLVTGTDLAATPNYAGVAPTAQRVHREVIILDARGTGHSEPDLDCPEVSALTDRTLAAATDDPAVRATYLDAVAACGRRLTDAGVDLSAYNLTEMAADAEQLRTALGIARWNVAASGTAGRIALEMLRDAPGGIRAVVLDSPQLPGADPRAIAVTGTRQALAAVVAACTADKSCGRAFPRVRTELPAILARLDKHPVTLAVRPADRPVTVRVDGAMLLRILRQMLSDGGSSSGLFTPGAVPAFVHGVQAGRLKAYATVMAAGFAGDVPYCLGYQPKCLPHHHTSLGVAYSILCHDVAPFAGPAAPARLAAGAPGFAAAYGRSPYLDVCKPGPAGRAAPRVAEPVRSAVPVLVLVGAFAPYSPPDAVRAGLSGLGNLTMVVDPGGGHNVVARTPCSERIRTGWLDDPGGRTSTDCIRRDVPAWQA